MTLCPFESVCVFANTKGPEADDLILREVFCKVRPNACTIFRRILASSDVPEGMRPHGCIRGNQRTQFQPQEQGA